MEHIEDVPDAVENGGIGSAVRLAIEMLRQLAHLAWEPFTERSGVGRSLTALDQIQRRAELLSHCLGHRSQVLPTGTHPSDNSVQSGVIGL